MKTLPAKQREQLQQLASSPALFRENVLIEVGGTLRRFGEVIEHWQRTDFEALDAAWLAVARGGEPAKVSRAWLERPRGHSKTGDIALMVTWALFASPRKLSGVVAAADRDQAAFIRDAIERLLRANPWLAKFIEVQRDKVKATHTGSELAILASDAPSSYGLTPDFVVLDEISHWSSRDLFDSLFSAAAKRPHCLLLAITNAGFCDSWQWALRELIRTDPRWHFRTLNGPQASWITLETLAEQRRILTEFAYKRLWLNQWVEGSGDAIHADDITTALANHFTPPAKAEAGWAYYVGVDLGVSRDAASVVLIGKHVGQYVQRQREERVIHRQFEWMERQGLIDPSEEDSPIIDWVPGTGRIRLVDCQVWQPAGGTRVSLDDVRAAIVELHGRFRFQLGADPYQAELMLELLGKTGISCERVDFLSANLKAMCQATLDAFTQKNIELFNHERLIADLRALRVEERSYGVRLTSPRGPTGHGDCATALSIALFMARRYEQIAHYANVNRPLVCYP